MNNKTISVAILIVCVALVVEIVSLIPAGKQNATSLQADAQKLVEDCKKQGGYRPKCYEDNIPKLMSTLSMEDAFEVTRIVQDIDRSYQYCHVLGHKLAAEETAKDPSRWQTVIARCPSGLCSNGCIHGAFQERFRKEALTPEEIDTYKSQFANVCEPHPGFNPTGLEQASCYHALGHLFMYVTGADIDRSLDLCRELAVKPSTDFSQLCFDGSFMQIYQPLEPDDFALIAGKEVDRAHVKSFCNRFTGKEQGSCWSESWPLFADDLQDPKKLVAHCEYLPSSSERDRCFNALMYVFTAQSGFDEAKITSYCAAMPAAHQGNCFAQAASRLIETDYRNSAQSSALCTAAEPYDKDHLCFRELLKYSTYNFHPGSESFTGFCSALPEPWKEECFAGAPAKAPEKAVAE